MNRRQTIPKHLRYTIQDFNRQFPTDESCLEHLKEQRFPGGITYCETCQQDRKHHPITGRPVYSCGYCGTQISPMAGTIFEHSSTSLRLWYYAMYLMASTRCGISAKQIQRETGVTYKTAWRMFKQIRSMLSDSDTEPTNGEFEADETYMGGKAKNRHQNKKAGQTRGPSGKTIVAGVVRRKGYVHARKIDTLSHDCLIPMIQERVLPASMVFTDEAPVYNVLPMYGYAHKRVHHAKKVYVDGDAHTCTIDGFWGLVKNGIRGVYHSVSDKYLQTYLDEYGFRYNRRK